jgi:hypothetical protein
VERHGRQVVPSTEVADLVDLVEQTGPFLTLWAARPSLLESGERSLLASARDAAGSLLPPEVVDALIGDVEAAFRDAEGCVAVATPDGVALVQPLAAAPRAGLARLGNLPSLAPVVEHRQAGIGLVTVLVDRQGADLWWTPSVGAAAVRHEDVAAADGPITKSAPGGWSQRRFQQRAENTWEHTGDEVAREVARVVQVIEPRIVTIGGDDRMVTLVRERLPAQVQPLLRAIPGGRSADGSADGRQHAVDRWLRTAVAEDTVAVLQEYARERGQLDRAAAGPAETLAALSEGRVDVLLVHDDPDDPRVAWFAAGSLLASDDHASLAAAGNGDIREARLVDVAVRGALLTSATVRVVPEHGPLDHGIGAVLRW